MSEEIALAAADLATVEALRARILEWEDCYDRLAGAFDLHMDILECKAALADLAGSYYDALLGAMWSELQAARALGAWANNRRYWTCGICPACGFGRKLDGSEFHGSGCAIAAYNAAVKRDQPAVTPPDVDTASETQV